MQISEICGRISQQEGSVNSVKSVGENHSKKVLCRSVKSVGELPVVRVPRVVVVGIFTALTLVLDDIALVGAGSARTVYVP